MFNTYYVQTLSAERDREWRALSERARQVRQARGESAPRASVGLSGRAVLLSRAVQAGGRARLQRRMFRLGPLQISW